jgi:hypothetical protein
VIINFGVCHIIEPKRTATGSGTVAVTITFGVRSMPMSTSNILFHFSLLGQVPLMLFFLTATLALPQTHDYPSESPFHARTQRKKATRLIRGVSIRTSGKNGATVPEMPGLVAKLAAGMMQSAKKQLTLTPDQEERST